MPPEIQEAPVDADVVEEPMPTEPGRQVVVHQHHDQPVELFPGKSPAEVLAQATEVANALKGVLTAQQMTTRIGNRDHVNVEGWQTLGALLKVTPVCVNVHRLEPATRYTVEAKKWGGPKGQRQVVETYTYEVEGHDWEATVEARTLEGITIGRATSMVSRKEPDWQRKDDYALIGMAQTRATSRALGSVLRFVVTLAGYSGTPAEEMPNGNGGNAGAQEAAAAAPARPYGRELEADRERVAKAVAFILGGGREPNEQAADSLLQRFRSQTFDGYDFMPQAAGVALFEAARDLARLERTAEEAAAQPDEDPDGDLTPEEDAAGQGAGSDDDIPF